MTYAADCLAGLNAIYDVAGVEAVYTDRAGTQTVVSKAVIEQDLSRFGDVAEITAQAASISVRKSELADPPRAHETYTIAGTVYTVRYVIAEDELEHTAVVV